MSWETVKLSQIASSQYGFTASSTSEPIGPRFLRITDIVPSSISWDNVPFCAADDATRKKYLLRKGDIVVARTGATTGYAKLIRADVDAIFASYLVRFQITDERANPDFVGRILESHVYKAYVDGVKGGAAQPNANAVSLGNFEFKLPPLPTQQRIAGILSAYDDLIENNRRRIGLLEQAARLLYREWFVHFRFPGHETAKFVDGLPEGWEKTTLGAHCPLIYGKALKSDARVDGPFDVYGSSGVVGTHNKAFTKGPAIIVGRKGNVGSIYWARRDFWPIDTVYFVDPANSDFFTYFALQHISFQSTDVAVPGLNRNYAHSRELCLPPTDLIQSFNDQAGAFLKQAELLSSQNDALTRARDLLLPRLMDGRIPV